MIPPHHRSRSIMMMMYLLLLALASSAWNVNLVSAAGTITSGVAWYDTNGERIYAGGGGFYTFSDSSNLTTYYWIGEGNKIYQDLSQTFNLYRSTDLVTWTKLKTPFDNTSIIADEDGPYRMERPKLFQCPGTKKYMLWFHCDTSGFGLSSVGVASSDHIEGPYLMDPNNPCFKPDDLDSYDMTIFVDQDQQPYLIRSVQNQYAGVSGLTSDCTDTTGIISKGPRIEGQAAFYDRDHDEYMLWGSHLTGWDANPAVLTRGSPSPATSMANITSWHSVSPENPSGSKTTFNSQSTDILPYIHADGHITYIYMGDRWNHGGHGGLQNATYIWLPIQQDDNGKWSMSWYDSWNLEDF